MKSCTNLIASVLATTALVAGCVSTPEPKSPAETAPAVTQPVAAPASSPVAAQSAKPGCDLVCERAAVLPSLDYSPDWTARAAENANHVLDGMKDDFLACYRRAPKSEAAAGITIDITIDPMGHVRDIETSGADKLGKKVADCIATRIKQGQFEPPHGGGTLQIRVPFSLRNAGEE